MRPDRRKRFFLLRGREVELARNLDAVLYGSCDRTTVRIYFQYPLYGLPVLLVSREVKGLRDPLDHQHLVLGLYLPHRVGVKAIVIERDLTRRQRARKGAE